MAHTQEKRNFARHPCECRIRLLHILGQGRHIEAHLLNFSAGGLSFISHHPIEPGTTIMLRASGECYNALNTGTDCLLRSSAMATVKWCQECPRQDQSTHEMGAAYLFDY
jgi:hypothetical protein